MKYVLLSTVLLSLGVFTSCNNKNTFDVMVVGVNDENPDFDEIDILIDSLTNKHTKTIDNINFYSGNINNKKVVIAQTPVGTSEAAMTTTIGIKYYHPKYVISEGTSGGHADEDHLEVQDIILGKDILDIASYKGNILDPEHGGEGEGPITLMHPTLHSDQTLLEKAYKVKYDYDVTKGIIASSDCWNTGENFVKSLHNVFNEDCEEMESYAVANVCNNYKIPSLAIRIISNNLMKPGADFDKTAGKNVQRYTINVINAI